MLTACSLLTTGAHGMSESALLATGRWNILYLGNIFHVYSFLRVFFPLNPVVDFVKQV